MQQTLSFNDYSFASVVVLNFLLNCENFCLELYGIVTNSLYQFTHLCITSVIVACMRGNVPCSFHVTACPP